MSNSCRTKIFILVSAMIFLSRYCDAQPQLYLVGSYDLGPGIGKHKFERNGTILQQNYWPNCDKNKNAPDDGLLNGHLGLHLRFTKQFAVESGILYSEYSLMVHDANFQRINAITDLPDPVNSSYQSYALDRGSYYSLHHYNGTYLAMYYHISSLYVAVGAEYNYFPGWRPTMTSTYSAPSGEMLQMDIHYARHFYNPYAEIGQKFYGGGGMFSVFLKIYGGGTVITADYKDYQNGTAVTSDRVTESGQRIGFGFRFGGQLFGGTSPHHSHYHRHVPTHHPRRFSKKPKHHVIKTWHPPATPAIKKKRVKSQPVINPDNVKSYRN